MTRREANFDAMLRYLGATYYQAIHGNATATDLTRALESAEAEDDREHADAPSRHHRRSGRWRVRDLMTSEVVT